MKELDIDVGAIASWFTDVRSTAFDLIRVSDEDAASWATILGVPVRQCYIDDALLEERATKLGVAESEVLAAKLPEPGSTMAGDFGEILVYLYHATTDPDGDFIGPKKWRLKQDRTKPAPYSDVVQFVLPNWPEASAEDQLLCSEVKTKSTSGQSTPIASAIEDSEKDRTSRLARTLVWLKERALVDDLGTTKIDHLDRFIKATDHPPARKHFRAVAVVCASLVEGELKDAPTKKPTDHTVVVVSIPNLKAQYEAVFQAARNSVAVNEDVS